MKIFYLTLIALFVNLTLSAANYTSVGDGNWSTYTNWSPVGMPQPGDNVIINTNIIIDDQYTSQGYWSVSAGSITINAGASLVAGTNVIGLAIQNNGVIINNGTLSINQMAITDGTLTNNSTCNFYSLIYNLDSLKNYGTIQEVDSFFTSGVFINYSNATTESDSIQNEGVITNDGSISVIEMYNDNLFTNNGAFSFNRYYNNDIFINNGTVNSTYDAMNAGHWTNNNGSTVSLAHSFTNADTLNSPSAVLIVNGSFSIGHNFCNTDTITGSALGLITVQDSSHNAGVMEGYFEFCDNTTITTTAPFIDLNSGIIASTITYCQQTNITEAVTFSNIRIYPNPAKNTVFIESENSLNNVKIINNIGQVLISTNTNSIDVSTIKSGIYIVIIETENTIIKRKLIIE